MPGKNIFFHSEKIKFSLKYKTKIKIWLGLVIQNEKLQLHSLYYIFCSDKFLITLNKKFLNHDYLTDVITFPLPVFSGVTGINGEIYISIPRVRENAKKFNSSFEKELHRVMVHGLLHLLGYSDNKKKKMEEMRLKEEFYLERLKK